MSTGGRMTEGDRRESATRLATRLVEGFQYHDEDDRAGALASFRAVDAGQFAHLGNEGVDAASEAFVDALWAKDDLEADYILEDGEEIDVVGLREADWSPIREAFLRRADAAGIDEQYADASTVAWRNHKVGGDYWSAFQQAQVYELRAALQNEEYPHKPRYGQSGFGPEAARYTVGVELHDMHTEEHWRQAVEVMTPYFERILRGHRE